MAWVFQFLVLALTALLWWLARRDLTSKAADARAPAAEDWARLRVTVEQLMVELERRAVVAEQRIYEAEQRLRLVEQRLQAAFTRADLAPGASAAPEPPVPLVSGVGAFAPPAARAVSGSAEPMPVLPTLSGAAPLTAPLLLPGAAAPPLAVDMSLRSASFVEAEPAAPALPAAPPPLRLTPEEARYLPVYALADAGQTDPAEIARQTGLPRGEIELVLSLRARRGA